MAMPTLKIIKPQTDAERTTHTTVDTIEVTPALVNSWKLPPFQRTLRVNAKVIALGKQIKLDGGVIPGVLTIGVFQKEPYLIDGQHRREAFLLSECQHGYVDVRFRHFNDLLEMGREFVELNSQLVRMGPNDVLRGLEATNPSMMKIRKRCPFVGYDQIRRGERSPVLAMSAVLRCWFGSATEVPKAGGGSALDHVATLTEHDAEPLCNFLECAMAAWGRDVAYQRLWLNLNLTLCMWLYRRTVVTQWSTKTPKLTDELFQKCLMSLSAADLYLDWLTGRNLSDRDRSPAYQRIKGLFAGRLELELGKKVLLPAPPWQHSSGS